MSISYRRLALLTGVSASAFGLSVPAFAATTTVPGIGHHDSSDPVVDTLIICDLGDDCFFGVDASGAGSVSAIVNSVATGRIEQTGVSLTGDVELEIINEGDAEIGAHASATAGDAGFAEARAAISAAVLQSGIAADGDVILEFTNSGELLIDAIAVAEGGETGAALAFATIETAILQAAVSTGGEAAVSLTNSGDLRIAATAVATGSGTGATASGASVAAFAEVKGITQIAIARDVETATETTADGNVIRTYKGVPVGPASVLLENSGDISMTAAASAQGENFALARATLTAVHQVAEGTEAIVELDNSGTIELAASAAASGTTYALAAAFVDGFHQTAYAMLTGEQTVATPLGGYTHTFSRVPVGKASVALVNSGSIEIAAIAHAVADPAGATATGVGAVAGAYVSGIFQNVAGSEASAEVVNSGIFEMLASAVATGDDIAAAQVNAIGMRQFAAATGFSITTVVPSTGTPFVTATTFGVGPATIALENSGEIDIVARAEAHGDSRARVDSTATGVWQSARGLDATVSIDNSGTFNVVAEGEVSADDAFAFVRAGGFIQQGAIAYDAASALIDNSGDLGVAAHASVIGSTNASAIAIAVGISQVAVAFESAIATLDNSGAIAVEAAIDAEGGTFAGGAALAIGAQQSALAANNAQLNMDNSGSMTVDVSVNAMADAFAAASALAVGVQQTALANEAQLHIDNSGDITVEASIDLEAGTSAVGYATATGVGQIGTALDAQLGIDNSGTIAVAASIDVEAGTSALGSALAIGARQSGFASDVQVGFDNSGDLIAIAEVNAVADDPTGVAMATAMAIGIGQVAFGAAANQSIDNSGSINVRATASAAAPSDDTDDAAALAFAIAYGVQQLNGGTATATQSFVNGGTIEVGAVAMADAAAGSATASAAALRSFGIGGGPLSVAIDNAGAITATASAVAVGKAYAMARGIYVNNAPNDVAGTPVNGTIDNSGSISVIAQGSGQTFSEVIGTGTTATTIVWGGSSVFATGVLVFGGANNMTITNSGSINVDAIATDGGIALAAGIMALSNAPTATAPTDVLTINNSGDIIVRQSTDGGETWQRGFAIQVAGNPDNNVLGAANRTIVNLLGGNIYGNIDLQDGDELNVTDSETELDGIINPECKPATFVAGDAPALSSCGQGSLNIVEDGTLVLLDPRFTGDPDQYDGPSYAFVEELNLDATGTIAFGLEPAAGGTQAPGSYSRVFTDTAALDGTLEARFAVENGLFADSYVWDNVIDANTRTGTFDRCVIGGDYAGSLLLDFDCTYDNQNNVDLTLTRIAFDEVDGLNRNGRSVGGGLEDIYDPDLTGGIADLLADLFLITDESDYNTALNQLSGSSYANYLQSFSSLGVHYNDLADRATSCEVPALAGSVLECRSGPIHVWGQLDYQKRKVDGDVEAGSYRSKRFAGLIGVDATLGESTILGVSGGVVSNHVRDRQFGDRIKSDGYQVGVYGVFDPGLYYVKGIGTYSWFDGDSRRSIDFEPLGGSFAGTLAGDPDVRMWTLGVHSGFRFTLGESSVLTPYVNLDFVNAKLKSFTETTTAGDEGAELGIGMGRAKNTFVTGGVKWAGRFGGIVPEANLGYRYRFGDRRASFTANSIGGEDTSFDIVSASEKRGALLAGLSVGGSLGRVNLRIGYEGEFNKDVRSHSGSVKLVLPLGGPAVAPASAPARVFVPTEVEPAPAPASAPEAIQAPPPPPPVQSGERGQ